ncbi:class I SAM-dependent methyltransferase [Fischerella thermalis]|uniref:class I SAM-dependent methyltransferase n=1 Tax=Fischerella thermalis TaxID=372787 RepID=UPI0011AFCE2E|nr:class I SAM-dependent methyltransferase [Fischerella thermalis]
MLLQRMTWLLVASLSITSLMLTGCTKQPDSGVRAQEPAINVQAQLREPDVIYVPTPQEVVTEMLKLANVTRKDVVYDLGSGDGRIPIAAAREFGARGVGIDIDLQRDLLEPRQKS